MTCRDDFYNRFYGTERLAPDIFRDTTVVRDSFSKPWFDANAMRAGRAFTVVSIFMTPPFGRRRRRERDWCWWRFAEVALPFGISELIMRGLPDRIGICTARRTSIYTCVTRNHYLVYTIHTSCNRRIAGVLLYLANAKVRNDRVENPRGR